jgi:hypothetical protein
VTFRLDDGLLPELRRLDNIGTSQLPFATAVALTRTAIAVRKAEQEEMRSVFDRPTPFSLNAFEVRPATKSDLFAEVAQKYATGTSKPRNWFDPQVYGGPRLAKGFEALLRSAGVLPSGWLAVPGRDAPLDGYGNMRRSAVVQILADLKASREAVYNMTDASRRRNKRARFFVIGKAGRRFVVRRVEKSTLEIVLVFVPRAVYAPRFAFFDVAERVSAERFPVEFDRAFADAIRTAR